MARFRFPYILTLSLSTLALGTVGCSHGSSPTEPAFDAVSAPVVATGSVTDSSSVTGEKRHGADDPAGDDRGGNSGGGNSGSGSGNSGSTSGGNNSTDDNTNNRRGRGRGGRGGNDDNPRPAGTSEFEARVVSVSGNTLNLAGGVRVTVNGATQWSARGDLRTLNATATAVSRNRPVRAEGRGTRQADGSFLAVTLKVEVDD